MTTTELLSDTHFTTVEDQLLKAIENDPENMEAHYTLGIMYAKREDFKSALKYLEIIEKHHVEYVFLNQVRTVIGYIYAIEEDYLKSKEHLLKVLDFNEENITALSILAYVYYKAKLFEQAIKIYQKALKTDQENPNLLNAIGFILIESELNINKGITYVKKALRLKPNTPSYLDSLGWGYYLIGEQEKAIETLKTAFELAPNSTEIKNHIKNILNM